MITIKNEQRIVAVNTKQLKADAKKVLAFLGYDDFDLGILLTTNKRIHQFNKQYRDKDKATDVLSFPFHDTLKPGEHIVPETEEDKNLGDIIIAPEYVRDDAANWDHTFDQRMRVLLVHGVCHLLGYDHETDEEYAVMHAQESRILSMLAQNDS